MSDKTAGPNRKIVTLRHINRGRDGEDVQGARAEELAEVLKVRFAELKEEGSSSKEAFLRALLEIRGALELED